MSGRRKNTAPDKVVVRYGERLYWRDLRRCRLALADHMETGDFRSARELAALIGVSRATTSAFMRGNKHVSLQTTNAILARLGMRFHDVHELVGQTGIAGLEELRTAMGLLAGHANSLRDAQSDAARRECVDSIHTDVERVQWMTALLLMGMRRQSMAQGDDRDCGDRPGGPVPGVVRDE